MKLVCLPSKVVLGIRSSFVVIHKKKEKNLNRQIFHLSPNNLNSSVL